MYIPSNSRYTVKIGSNGLVYINDKRLNSTYSHNPAEFVSGQIQYNEDTADYPDYVHNLVWSMLESQRREQRGF